ncbi:MAG: hypothetical protein WHS87_05635 [Anaerolineales bacterium]
MKHKLLRLSALWLVLLWLLACNLPRPPLATPAAGSPTRPVLFTPSLPPRTSTSTLMPPSPSVTPTLAEATPSLFLADATRCRQGPGEAFAILTVVPAGAQLPLLGRWEGQNYWLVRLEDGTTCWMWGGAATPQGSLSSLTAVTPPPSPTLIAPGTVQNLRYVYSCEYVSGGTQVTVSLTWNETPGAQGYRVYRNGLRIAEITTPFFSEVTSVASLSEILTYSVEAFNAGGASSPKSISFSCQ